MRRSPHHRVTTLSAMAAVALLALTILTGCSKSADAESVTPGNPADLRIAPLMRVTPDGHIVGAGVSAPDQSSSQNQSSPTSAASPAGDGNGRCRPTTIALLSALTGTDAGFGGSIANGAQLAVDEHNAANARCRITLKKFDTRGELRTAGTLARRIAADKNIAAVIGPEFSSEVATAAPVLDKSGIAMLSASATVPGLTDNGWTTFFRGVANNDVQGRAMARYLTSVGKRSVCVVADDTDYGATLAASVSAALGSTLANGCAARIQSGSTDLSAVAAKAQQAGADALFFAGSSAQAAALARVLRTAAPGVALAAGDTADSRAFVTAAAGPARGTLISCPCAPAPAGLAAAYSAAFREEPGAYSTTAYDLATILVNGIDAGRRSRGKLLSYLRSYEGAGLARRYHWTPKGELTESDIWLYQVT